MSKTLKIQEFSLERLHNTGDSAFLERVSNAADLLTQEADQAMVEAFREAFKAFNDVVKLSQSSFTTEEITRLDELADSAWRGLHAQAKVMLRHPSEQVRRDAHDVMTVIDKYGDITNLSYNDEYGAMDNLITDVKAFGEQTLQRLYLSDWVEELTTRRSEFMFALSVRENEKAAAGVGETKAKRKAADRAYRDFVEMVNAKAMVLGVAPYEVFILRVNVIIDEAKRELALRAAQKKTTDEPAVDLTLPSE